MQTTLTALSPLDGRYHHQVKGLAKYFSEASLIENRVKVEVLYLKKLSEFKIIRKFTKVEKKLLLKLQKLSTKDFNRIKTIEKKIHHDVKAIEYFLRKKIEKTSLKDISSFIHFAITSEDINNLAYRLMFKNGFEQEVLPVLKQTLAELINLAEKYQALPILARTHGQPAIPTTLGKELTIFAERIFNLIQDLSNFKFTGKFNGAVGGYQAMVLAYPKINWLKFSKSLVDELGFEHNQLTTQINSPDDLMELFSLIQRVNMVLIDLNQDIWRYISDDWLIQKAKKGEVGSSTMPQKVNPINFENSEGNLSLANALLIGFLQKLPVSRLQRDLSESTVLRNVGTAFGYSYLAYQSLAEGLKKLSANEEKIATDLSKNYNILLEAWQTVARKNGQQNAYEQAAKLGKNKVMTQEDWQELVVDNKTLTNLTPEKYLGLSIKLTKQKIKKIRKGLS